MSSYKCIAEIEASGNKSSHNYVFIHSYVKPDYYKLEVVEPKNFKGKTMEYKGDKVIISNPDIKALFVVNPSNPPSVAISQKSISEIVDIVKTKNKDLKQTAGSSAFSALVAGITEPALYGITVRLKRPMLGACIGAATGGLVGGFFQLKCFGVATPALVTIPQYIESTRSESLIYILITAAVTIGVSFIATYFIGFEDVVDEEDEEIEETNSSLNLNTGIKVPSPIEGVVVPLEEVNDSTFSTGVLGKGIAVIPTKGEVISPFDGTVDAFFETHHALGLKSNDGLEMLIHIGLETVNLKGKYFTPKVKAGSRVEAGELLLEFDLQAIAEEGYDTVIPIIVTNTPNYRDVELTTCGQKKAGENLLGLV